MEVGDVLIAVGGTLPAGEIHGSISFSTKIVHHECSSSGRHWVAEGDDLLCSTVSTERRAPYGFVYRVWVCTPADELTRLLLYLCGVSAMDAAVQ